jgi:hypothetical protein
MDEAREHQMHHTYRLCVMFGMWLQQPAQRKRLAKSTMTDLYKEWIELISQQLGDE